MTPEQKIEWRDKIRSMILEEEKRQGLQMDVATLTIISNYFQSSVEFMAGVFDIYKQYKG